MDNKDVLKFVIVGHVDHGKSTLIGRLFYDTDSLPEDKIQEVKQASEELGRDMEFGFLMDHLKEERDQGITIDTTQAFFTTSKRKYVIIDAPGHVEFVKNMITGASQAEAAMLIIDAEEGVREQTKRHAYILSLLGLEQVIVLINKMDLINFDEKKFIDLKIEIEQFLSSINIHPISYIPISAAKGDNVAEQSKTMTWYTGPTVLDNLDTLKNKQVSEKKPLLMPVQDAYKIDSKRIYVGKIETGTISSNQTIKILPEGQTTQVKSLEKFKETPEKCFAGESIGLTTNNPVFIERGNIICEPEKEPAITTVFEANLFWMSKNKLDINEKITIKCATQECLCKIDSIISRMNSSSLEIIEKNSKILENLEVGQVVIKTDSPICIKPFSDVEELGRFVLVKNDNVCAGGIITSTEKI